MNKINFKRNCVISPIKVVLFLLIVVCIILAFMEFDKEICIGTFVMNISSTSTLILMLFLLVVSLVFYIYRKDNKETVGKFIKPFCKASFTDLPLDKSTAVVPVNAAAAFDIVFFALTMLAFLPVLIAVMRYW